MSSTIRFPAVVLLCLMASGGCNRSNNAEVKQAKAETEAARAEFQAAKAELAKANVRADAAEGELAKLKDAKTKPFEVPVPSPDRKAAEWVLRVEGSVTVVADGVSMLTKKDGKLPDGPIKVVEITLSSPKASDDGTSFLNGLKDLRVLIIQSNGTASLTGITNYDFLEQFSALEHLEAGGMSDADLMHIKGLSKLKFLDVGLFFGNARITNAGMASVKDLKQLEVLGLLGCTNVSDAGLLHLKGLKSLKRLHLSRTNVSDACLEHLKDLTNLEDLRLGETKITDTGMISLKDALPKCNISKQL